MLLHLGCLFMWGHVSRQVDFLTLGVSLRVSPCVSPLLPVSTASSDDASRFDVPMISTGCWGRQRILSCTQSSVYLSRHIWVRHCCCCDRWHLLWCKAMPMRWLSVRGLRFALATKKTTLNSGETLSAAEQPRGCNGLLSIFMKQPMSMDIPIRRGASSHSTNVDDRLAWIAILFVLKVSVRVVNICWSCHAESYEYCYLSVIMLSQTIQVCIVCTYLIAIYFGIRLTAVWSNLFTRFQIDFLP